jgi:hypothetical protein
MYERFFTQLIFSKRKIAKNHKLAKNVIYFLFVPAFTFSTWQKQLKPGIKWLKLALKQLSLKTADH